MKSRFTKIWLLTVIGVAISGAVYVRGQAAQVKNDDRKPIVIERSPQRMIKDPYPSFSAVAVNPEDNMLIVTDENLYRVLEYDRRDNTPPQARLTEPKRVISGPDTRVEMLCGAYIDPVTKEVYVTNNDTQNWLPVFPKDAKGNVAPTRYLAAPHGTFGIAVREETQEMYLTVQHQNSIVVYRKQATGNDKPLREIVGGDTQLKDPHGIALDTKNKLIFVSNFGNAQVHEPGSSGRRGTDTYGRFEPPSISVYPLDAKGNVKPLWTIEGPLTRMNWPSHIVVHEERQELFVANDADDSILVFRTTDKGNVAPIRTIKGPNTGIKNPPGIALDTKNEEISVASMGTHAVLFFPVTANGDVKPSRIIRGGPADQLALNIGNPGAVGYDTKRDQILVPNWVAHPQIAAFARLANGAQPPERTVYGQASKLSRTMHDIRYDEMHDEFFVVNPFAGAILAFRGGTGGQEGPIRIIQGPHAKISGNRLDVDPIHNEIFVPDGNKISVYPRDGNGDVSPIRVIQGPDTQLSRADTLSVDPINDILVVGFNKGEGDRDPDGALLIFNRTDNGNVKPRAVIRGPKSGIVRINQMALYPPKKLIVATMPGHVERMEPPEAFLGIWTYDDNGDVAPKWKIPVGSKTTLKKPFGVVLNPKNKEIIISDMRVNGVLTFSVPEIF